MHIYASVSYAVLQLKLIGSEQHAIKWGVNKHNRIPSFLALALISEQFLDINLENRLTVDCLLVK